MEEILRNKIENAISKLFMLDHYLLINDLNERTIAHKFAVYLQEQFPDYHIDCEYNKNIDEDNGSKNIRLLKSIPIQSEEEWSTVSIYPDIVVHKRGENCNNLLAIEIKKSTNKKNREYDFQKLKCYTDKSEYNKLHYDWGLFIEFQTGIKELKIPELTWFKNNERIHYAEDTTDNTALTHRHIAPRLKKI